MSKWRPVHLNCLYVIPDSHGNLEQVKLIFDRIMPLRKSDGGKDILVMLGDYIDRGPQTPELIDFLIEAKKKYRDQLVLLSGNHELMLLDALIPYPGSNQYLFWMHNGGEQTLVSYLKRKGSTLTNPYSLPRSRLIDFIPQEHLDFFKSLQTYYEIDDYIFVHGGCDPSIPIKDQEKPAVIWDRSLLHYCMRTNGERNHWDKIIVTGHNCQPDGLPIIQDKFMMLDCSSSGGLLVVEMNSMEAFMAGKKAWGQPKARLVKYDLLPK